jgi:limonene-1,2-epoxide hydrolase
VAGNDPEGVVREFCVAFGRHDAQALRPFLADDVFYHNIPMEPCVGIEATIAFIEGFFAMCDRIEIENTHVAVNGNLVLTERIDTFTMGEVVGPLPVMGTFEVVDAKIVAWRDYFDMAQVTAMFTAGAG